ncbi:MAG: hypothetical protein H7X86_05485 [Gorillibacterium sp.]|nr:hypothetical protein [Gorillibacterium sp.]
MSDAVQTLEGWYCLHDFHIMNWSSWKYISPDERAQALEELSTFLHEWKLVEDNKLGSFVLYSVSSLRLCSKYKYAGRLLFLYFLHTIAAKTPSRVDVDRQPYSGFSTL